MTLFHINPDTIKKFDTSVLHILNVNCIVLVHIKKENLFFESIKIFKIFIYYSMIHFIRLKFVVVIHANS